jgi:hypothetical protein
MCWGSCVEVFFIDCQCHVMDMLRLSAADANDCIEKNIVNLVYAGKISTRTRNHEERDIGTFFNDFFGSFRSCISMRGQDTSTPLHAVYFDVIWSDPIEKTAEKAKARNWTTQPKALD